MVIYTETKLYLKLTLEPPDSDGEMVQIRESWMRVHHHNISISYVAWFFKDAQYAFRI